MPVAAIFPANSSPQPARFFAASPRATLAAVILIFLAGLGVRLYQLKDPPLEFHAERQVHSMFIARGLYYQQAGSPEDWKRSMAIEQYHGEGLIEPQITETVVAILYRLVGQVDLRIPRLLSILFWSLGGLGIFFLARDLTDANGAVVAFAFYMTNAFGVMVSRSFMPEPLLMAALIWAWWAMVHWYRQQDWRRAILAGLLSGFAILVKATAVFFIGAAWLGLLLFGVGLRKALTSRQVWLMALLTVLPYGIYHLYGVVISGQMTSQFSLRFFPGMWREPASYFEWYKMIRSVVRFEWLIVAILGIFLLRDRFSRGMLLGVLAGYGLYGMVFIYYTTTHDYYHLPLIPLVAIGLGSVMGVLAGHIHLGPRWSEVVFVGILLVPSLANLADAMMELRSRDFYADVALAEEVGALFTPEDKVVALAPYYCGTLRYWGWVNATNWMSTQDFALRQLAGQNFDMQDLFNQSTMGMDTFLVMNFDELNNQPELKKLLEEGYTVVARTNDYVLYDLRQPLSR